jgi:RNA ligase (TIGR02306 family)
MSSCIVEVCRIQALKPHPDADALELAIIKGWQCVVPIGKYAEGDLVTYIPVDALIPLEHSDRWGITKYLSVRTDAESGQTGGQVRCAKLRGKPSFGVIVELEDPTWTEGQDVKDHYGIKKYIPPLRPTAGDVEKQHPLFQAYTDVENLRNFVGVLEDGEPVHVTEKIHGTSSRIAIIEGEVMAGSMGLRRKRPESLDEMVRNLYWFPYTLPAVRALLEALSGSHRQVVLYGEVFGSKVQSLHYGHSGLLGYRTFDVMLDGEFLDSEKFFPLCASYGVETVPLLYEGAYSLQTIAALAEGNTTLSGEHVREGVVVKPVRERRDPSVGRVVLKYIGDGYNFSKAARDDVHDV